MLVVRQSYLVIAEQPHPWDLIKLVISDCDVVFAARSYVIGAGFNIPVLLD